MTRGYRAYRARHDRHLTVGEGPGAIELVGDQQDRTALPGAALQQVVEEVAAGGVEAGMGLVEQQQARAAGQCHGEARPPLLPGGEPPEGHSGQPAEAELLEDGIGVGHLAASGPDPEPHVLPDGQVVVGAGSMTDEGHIGADRMAVGGEIVPEYHGGAGRQRQEPGQEPQQRRLTGAVGPGHEDHLAFHHVEIDAGQGRIAAEEAHGGAQIDGRWAQIDSICSAGLPRLNLSVRRSAHILGVVDRLRSVLSALGAILTGAGVLILLFVAYQLWGTGLYTDRQQDSLKSQFKQKAQVIDPASSTTTTTLNPLEQPPPAPTGEAVANIRIPKIGVDKYVVQGVGLADLRKGPGHYPETPMPGEQGNAAIAGHRTTYGAPFNRLDELAAGDEVLVTTVKGTFTYTVAQTHVVKPNQVEVLNPTPTPTLTLTTCNPKYSAKERLVVVANLAPGQKATAPTPSATTTTTAGGEGKALPGDEELEGDAGLASGRSKVPTIIWGTVTALIGLGWWLGIRKRRHWTSYAFGVVPFLVALFFFYAHLELLLPANF